MSDSSQQPGPGGIRASDSDREATVLILNKALGDGRINATEHDQRMSAAYAAVTMGELTRLTSDLPATPPPPPGPPAVSHQTPAQLQSNAGSGMRAMWLSWLGVSGFMIAIWLVGIVTSDSDSWQGFWPLWVIVPWGAVMLMRTIIDSDNDQR